MFSENVPLLIDDGRTVITRRRVCCMPRYRQVRNESLRRRSAPWRTSFQSGSAYFHQSFEVRDFNNCAALRRNTRARTKLYVTMFSTGKRACRKYKRHIAYTPRDMRLLIARVHHIHILLLLLLLLSLKRTDAFLWTYLPTRISSSITLSPSLSLYLSLYIYIYTVI